MRGGVQWPLPEPADARHPFTLSTGRGSSSQWHTQTRTGKSAVLRRPCALALERVDAPPT